MNVIVIMIKGIRKDKVDPYIMYWRLLIVQAFSCKIVSGSITARTASGQEITIVMIQTKHIFKATIVRDLFLSFKGLEIPK